MSNSEHIAYFVPSIPENTSDLLPGALALWSLRVMDDDDPDIEFMAEVFLLRRSNVPLTKRQEVRAHRVRSHLIWQYEQNQLPGQIAATQAADWTGK